MALSGGFSRASNSVIAFGWSSGGVACCSARTSELSLAVPGDLERLGCLARRALLAGPEDLEGQGGLDLLAGQQGRQHQARLLPLGRQVVQQGLVLLPLLVNQQDQLALQG